MAGYCQAVKGRALDQFQARVTVIFESCAQVGGQKSEDRPERWLRMCAQAWRAVRDSRLRRVDSPSTPGLKVGFPFGPHSGYARSQVRGSTAPSGGSSVVFNIYGSVPGDDVGGDPHAADGGRRSDTDVDLLKWRRRAEGEPPGGTRRFRSLLFVLIALLLLTMTPSCCR